VTVRGCAAWYAPTDLLGLAEDHPEGRYDAADSTPFEALLLGTAPAKDPARDG
jgi:hypothetical protein